MAKSQNFRDYLFKRNGMQFPGAWLLLPVIFLFASNSQMSFWQTTNELTLPAWGGIIIIEVVILLILYFLYHIGKR